MPLKVGMSVISFCIPSAGSHGIQTLYEAPKVGRAEVFGELLSGEHERLVGFCLLCLDLQTDAVLFVTVHYQFTFNWNRLRLWIVKVQPSAEAASWWLASHGEDIVSPDRSQFVRLLIGLFPKLHRRPHGVFVLGFVGPSGAAVDIAKHMQPSAKEMIALRISENSISHVRFIVFS